MYPCIQKPPWQLPGCRQPQPARPPPSRYTQAPAAGADHAPRACSSRASWHRAQALRGGGGKEGGRGIGCLAGKAVVHGVNWSSPHGHTRFAWGQPQRCSNGRRATRCSRLLAGWRPARGRAHLQKQCTMQSEQGSSARLYLARSCGEGRGKAVGMRVRLGAPSRFLSVQGSTRARSGQSASRAHAGLPAPRVSRGTWRSGPRCEHWTARASTHLPARGAGEAADKGLAAEVNQAVPDAALQRRRGAHHQ
jgi:hypothetical protein